MDCCAKYILALPLEQEPSNSFKRFVKDLQEASDSTCYAQYWKDKNKVQFSSNNLVNKNGTLGRHSFVIPMELGLEPNEIESFSTRFNMAMSLPQSQREIFFEIFDVNNSYCKKRYYVLQITVSVKTVAAKITLDNFFTLTSY